MLLADLIIISKNCSLRHPLIRVSEMVQSLPVSAPLEQIGGTREID
jgi:hypothetical protein